MTRSESRILRRHCRRMVLEALMSLVPIRPSRRTFDDARGPRPGRTGDIRIAWDQFNS